MKPIYEPKGKAKEYGDYAINIYTGCPHKCYYCFAPNVLHKAKDSFHNCVEPRKNIVEEVRNQIEREHITGKLIHLCFTCDPYPTGYDTTPTREIIKILKDSGNNVQILTKGDGIFGCINPKRQTILEKYMMCKVLERIGPVISNEDIYSLCTDEIVIDVGEKFVSQLGTLISFIKGQIKTLDFDCHINPFSVEKIGKDMYKQVFVGGFSDDSGFTYKRVNYLMMPFVIRKERGEEPIDSDYVFKNESGQLCRFLKNPLIKT